MKRSIHGIVMAICSIILISCNNGFDGSEVFKKDFEERSNLFAGTHYLSIFDQELTTQQREAKADHG